MKHIFLFFFSLFYVGLFGQTPSISQGSQIDSDISHLNKEMVSSQNNYTSFSIKNKKITQELKDNTPDSLELHPEFGILPPDAPCNNCYELLDKRTPNKRQFVKYETDGSDKFYQQSYDNFNYTDANGMVRSRDNDLYTTNTTKLYSSWGQESTTSIDLNNSLLSINAFSSDLKFHKNLKLYVNTNNSKQLLHTADWSNASVGSDGGYVTNIFPGIDLEIIAKLGALKTNFIVNSSFIIPQGEFLVIEDDVELPFNTSYDLSNSYLNNDNLYVGRLDISDNTTNSSLFYVDGGLVTDSSYKANSSIALAYNLNANKVEYYVPLNYINDPSRVFPIYIDPLFTTTNTTAQGSILAGFLNFGGFVDGCDYFMSVATPINTTIVDILWKFDYRAQFGAPMADGGTLFFYNGCRSPMPITNWWYCNSPAGGNCNSGAGISTFGFFSSCVPAPQCASYNMNFQLEFFERYDFDNACGGPYIVPNSNWIMTVRGRTVQQTPVPSSSAGTTLCNLVSTTLTATGTFGVPPYTYSWTPGPIAGNPIVVNAPPNTSTTYTCTITDACGITATNSITINKNICLPITLKSFIAEALNNEEVELTWITESEINNDFFTIERSRDGENFEEVAIIPGAGNSNVSLTYKMKDQKPLNGVSYYRLKQTDFNGDYEYSSLIQVEINKQIDDVIIYPNPVGKIGYVAFNSTIDGLMELEILDMTGKKLGLTKHQITNGDNKVKFDTENLPEGMYFIRLKSGIETSSFKFTKN